MPIAPGSRRAWLAAWLLQACVAAPAPREEPVRFVFQSSFWVNLHHCLRAEARRRERGAELQQPLEALTPGEREAWTRALDAYGPLAKRSLLFDEGMVQLHVALAAADAGGTRVPTLDAPSGAELGPALAAAAPVFRAHLWPARARTNDEWIERTAPAVARLAPRVTAELAAVLQLDWPARPILVDVTPETGPDLAYTTDVAPPGFAGLATINPSVAGGSAAAIECVFHEAVHVLDARLVRWVEEESARQGVAPPAELWHALLFYTAGALTARALGEAGTYRADLAQGFPAFLPALDAYWQPYLDGELALDVALRELVHATGAPARP